MDLKKNKCRRRIEMKREVNTLTPEIGEAGKGVKGNKLWANVRAKSRRVLQMALSWHRR